MRFWRLREVDPSQWSHEYYGEEDGYVYFRKDKMSRGTGIIYLTEEAAQRALSQKKDRWYDKTKYEVVKFDASEVE